MSRWPAPAAAPAATLVAAGAADDAPAGVDDSADPDVETATAGDSAGDVALDDDDDDDDDAAAGGAAEVETVGTGCGTRR